MLRNGQSLLSQTHKKTCNSFFIRSKFHPNSPRGFTTQTANLLLSPLPEQCFPPYVTLYENASALGIFAISSQPLKYGSRYYTGHKSGDWKARKCGLAGHSINLYPQNGIKWLFWSQWAGRSTEMSIIPWERDSLCLNQEMVIFALSHARRCHSCFYLRSWSLSVWKSILRTENTVLKLKSFLRDVKIFRSNSCVGG